VLITFARAPNDLERLEMERETIALAGSIPCGGAGCLERSWGRVEVRDIEGMAEPDYDRNGIPFLVHGSGVGDIVVAGETVGVGEANSPFGPPILRNVRSRVVIARPRREPVDLDDLVERAADRIERKLAQARSPVTGTKRMIVAQLLEDAVGIVRDPEAMPRFRQRLVEGHADVAAVLVCSRVWSRARRFCYVGTVIGGVPQDPIVRAIMRWSARTDYRRDPFRDWDYN
jgi:hypothetical protein